MRLFIHAGNNISHHPPHSAEYLLIMPVEDDATRRPTAVCFVGLYDSDSAKAPQMHTNVEDSHQRHFRNSVPHNSSLNTKQGDELRGDERTSTYEGDSEGKSSPPSLKAGFTYQLSSSRWQPTVAHILRLAVRA